MTAAAAAAWHPRVARAANVTWSPSDKVNVTLDGSRLIATATGQGGARASDSKTTGKYYWEVTANPFVNSGGAVGVAVVGANLATLAINGTGASLVYRTGNIYTNNVSTGINIGNFAGLTVCVAVDFGAALIWLRTGAAGNWNGNVSNNPATAVGGLSFTTIGVTAGTTAVYPVGVLGQTSDVLTGNFGDSVFAGAVPAGFTAGFTAAPTSVPTLSQLGLGIN